MFDEASFAGLGVSERPSFMAEQRVLDQPPVGKRTVQRDEAARASAEMVQLVRDDLFARPTFAEDEDRRPSGAGELLDLTLQRGYLRASAHHGLRDVFGVQASIGVVIGQRAADRRVEAANEIGLRRKSLAPNLRAFKRFSSLPKALRTTIGVWGRISLARRRNSRPSTGPSEGRS